MNNTDQVPPVAEQRQMLQTEIDELRRIGFSAFMQLRSLQAQNKGADDKRKINLDAGGGRIQTTTFGEMQRQLREKVGGAKAAAADLEDLLNALPDSEKGDSEEPAADQSRNPL